ETLEETTAQTVTAQRSAASLLGVFGVLALLLAAVGIYGVAAHSVSIRTREIGIRMSLGARAADVLTLFVRETLVLAGVGALIGLGAGVAASQVLTTFLFGLTATDGLSFAAGTVVIGVVAALASYLPARRASRIAPLEALRHD